MRLERRRPLMPGYGIEPSDAGMLDWAWALERLVSSRDYWVATLHPEGRPNLTPVWGVWMDDALWFSCSNGSRKARNLDRDPNVSVATDDAEAFVVLEGVAERGDAVRAFHLATTAKYGEAGSEEFIAANALFRVRPSKVLALTEDDFGGSPTCWDVG